MCTWCSLFAYLLDSVCLISLGNVFCLCFCSNGRYHDITNSESHQFSIFCDDVYYSVFLDVSGIPLGFCFRYLHPHINDMAVPLTTLCTHQASLIVQLTVLLMTGLYLQPHSVLNAPRRPYPCLALSIQPTRDDGQTTYAHLCCNSVLTRRPGTPGNGHAHYMRRNSSAHTDIFLWVLCCFLFDNTKFKLLVDAKQWRIHFKTGKRTKT